MDLIARRHRDQSDEVPSGASSIYPGRRKVRDAIGIRFFRCSYQQIMNRFLSFAVTFLFSLGQKVARGLKRSNNSCQTEGFHQRVIRERVARSIQRMGEGRRGSVYDDRFRYLVI